MALYLLSIKPISRTQNRSSVEAAAYRSAQKLYNEREDITHDFTRKKGVVHTEILLPENAPSGFSNREILWNAVEHAEKRRDSRTAREIVLALPRELTLETSKALVRKFVSVCFIPLGMCADICIHAGLNKNKNHKTERNKTLPHNPHAHILLTDRPVRDEGFCDKKNPDWNSKQYLNQWRECWANLQNEVFIRKGLEIRVSHESYKKRGIAREPTKHLGPVVMAMERRNINTKLGNENRAIEARNKEQHQLQLEQKRARAFDLSR